MSSLEGFPSAELPNQEENETKEEIKGFLSDINKFFNKKYGLLVPEEKLPQITISPVDSPAYVEKDENGEPLNILEIKKAERIFNGETIGEEMSHFYRAYFRPDHKEILTDEFFGFLGRRMLYEATKGEDGESYFFEDGKPSVRVSFLGTKKQVINRLKLKKNKLRKLTQEHGETTDEKRKEEIIAEGKPILEDRENISGHYRGYEFASKFDLSKVSDWQKFYSMPDEEVRKRFFTPNPDYSGL